MRPGSRLSPPQASPSSTLESGVLANPESRVQAPRTVQVAMPMPRSGSHSVCRPPSTAPKVPPSTRVGISTPPGTPIPASSSRASSRNSPNPHSSAGLSRPFAPNWSQPKPSPCTCGTVTMRTASSSPTTGASQTCNLRVPKRPETDRPETNRPGRLSSAVQPRRTPSNTSAKKLPSAALNTPKSRNSGRASAGMETGSSSENSGPKPSKLP